MTENNKAQDDLAQEIKILEKRIAELEQTDIKRKEVEQVLKASEIRYRRLFEAAKDGILILDFETGAILDVNTFLIDLLGYSKSEFLEKFIWDIGVLKDIVKSKDHFAELKANEYIRFEDLPLHLRSGEKIAVEFVSNVYLANNKKVIQCNIRDISARKKTEEALRENNALFRGLFHHVTSGVAVYEAIYNGGDFIFKDFNPAAEKIEKISRKDILGKRVSEVFKGVKAFGIFEVFQRVWKTGKAEYFPSKIYKDEKDPGSWRENWVFKLPSGEIVALYNDITEQKKAQEALSFTKAKLESALQASHTGVWQLHIKENKRILDEQACLILGINLATFRGTPEEFLAVVHPSDHERVKAALKKTIEQDAPYDYEYCVVWPDGSLHDVAIRGHLLHDDQGDPQVMTGIIRDITERKKTEKALQESNQRFQAIFNSTFHFTGLMTVDGFLLEANQTALDFAGAKIENVIDRPFWETPWWQGNEERVEKLKDAIRRASQGEFLRYEVELSGVKNTAVIFDFSLRPIFDPSGKVLFLVPEARDISRYKKAEKEICESEQRYRTLFEKSKDAIFIADPETRTLVDCNQAALEMTGYAKDEILSMRADQLHPQDVVDATMEVFRQQAEGMNVIAESVAQTKAGRRVDVSINTAIVELQGKVYVMGVFRDITEGKKAEQALFDSEKKLNALFDSMTEMVVLHELVFDGDGQAINYRIVDVNSAFTKTTGIEKEAALGKLATEVYRSNDAPYLKEYAHTAITGESCEFITYFSPMEKYFSISVTSPSKNQFTTTTIDITERKQMEEALRSRTALLEAQTNATIDGILIVDSHQRRILMNQRIVELFNIPPYILEDEDDAALLKYVVSLTKHPEQFFEKVQYLYDHIIETSRDEVEFKNGMVLDRYSAPVLGTDGKNYGRIWIFRDITDRRKAEVNLKKSEARFRSYFDLPLSGVVITSPEKGWIEVNEKTCLMLGYSREELFAMTWSEMTHPDDLADDVEQFNRMLSGEIENYKMDKRFIRKDGKVVWTRLGVGCVRDPHGKVEHVVALLEDITERKELEEKEGQHLHELEVFYKASLGREERVVELKKEVEELKEKYERMKKNE